MHIYGNILSPYAARVVIAARHKGLKFTMAPPEGGYKSAAYLKINPLGKVPALRDGKVVLFESAVIVEYLDAKYKKKRLVPAVAKDNAKARLIGAIFAEYVQSNGINKLFPHMGPNPDQAALKAAFADIERFLDIADDMIAAKPFAAGAKITIADCLAAPTLHFATLFLPRFGIEKPLGDRKKLARYMAKVAKDKVIGGVLKEMTAAYEAWSTQQQAA